MQPLISGSILSFFVPLRKWTSQIRQYQHILEPILTKNTTSPYIDPFFKSDKIFEEVYRMVPPSDVCGFINPMKTIVISAINHSYGSYKPT
jgi:hypothetical protein